MAMNIDTKIKKLEKEINDLKTKCNICKDQLEGLIGEEQCVNYCKALLTLPLYTPTLERTEAKIEKLRNDIETTAAKQYPKETDYNVIGVVDQYITCISQISETADPVQNGYANARAELCKESISEHYPQHLAEKLIDIADILEFEIKRAKQLSNSLTTSKIAIKIIEKGNPKVKQLGTDYYNGYQNIYKKSNEIIQLEKEKNKVVNFPKNKNSDTVASM